MESLEGKVAIVTGGSEGIGRAIAIELSKAGVTTAIVSRGEEKLKAALEMIQFLPRVQKLGLNPIYIAADVTKEEDIRRIVETAKRTYGHIDILVNSAGVYNLDFIKNIPIGRLKQIIDTNLTGTAMLTAETLRVFEDQGYGAIVDIGSTSALEILDQNNTYAASKHGMRVFSIIAGLEHQGIKMYRLHPSNTDTEGRKTDGSDLERKIKQNSKFLRPEEIGVEAVKLLTGYYGPAVHEIKVYLNNAGEKIVEKIDVRTIVDTRRLN